MRDSNVSESVKNADWLRAEASEGPLTKSSIREVCFFSSSLLHNTRTAARKPPFLVAISLLTADISPLRKDQHIQTKHRAGLDFLPSGRNCGGETSPGRRRNPSALFRRSRAGARRSSLVRVENKERNDTKYRLAIPFLFKFLNDIV